MAAAPLWTIADRDAVKAAVMDLATGKRAVKVSYAGPPARDVEYTAADLGVLERLLFTINAAVSGAPAVRLAASRKGLNNGLTGGTDPFGGDPFGNLP